MSQPQQDPNLDLIEPLVQEILQQWEAANPELFRHYGPTKAHRLAQEDALNFLKYRQRQMAAGTDPQVADELGRDLWAWESPRQSLNPESRLPQTPTDQMSPGPSSRAKSESPSGIGS